MCYIQTMQVIYIDSFFIINLMVNYLLIAATAKLSAIRVRRMRFLLAAATGAAYAVVTALPHAPEFIGSMPVRIAFGVLLALIAFGGERNFGRLTIILFALSACFAGASLLVGSVSFKSVLLTVAAAYAVITCVFRFTDSRKARASPRTVTLKISLNGSQCAVTVLNDSGNGLRDPKDGTIMPILNYGAVKSLFSANTRRILESVLSPAEKFYALAAAPPRFRLIPYNAVGVSGGLLLAAKADGISGAESLWFAISPNEINAYGGII
jgi:stage II sporulation protein GA (sporulation sigma-E factor processing peptidase)